jgi:hypothetical protein
MIAPETSTPFIMTGTPGRPGTTMTGSVWATAESDAATVPAIRLEKRASFIPWRARIGFSETGRQSLSESS